jgi:hypothetical protein
VYLRMLSYSSDRVILSVHWNVVFIPLHCAPAVKTHRSVGRSDGSRLTSLISKFRSHLVEGTPATVLGSIVTSTVLSAEDPEKRELFRELGLLRTIAKKVLDNIGSDKYSISRFSRESKELLKALQEDELQGVF